MRLALIVARAANGVIGRANQLPWHLPNDLKYFRQITMGKPIIMGRKTYDSIGKPLPGRKNIVITRQVDYQAAEDVVVVSSLGEAIESAKAEARRLGSDEAVVIGGEQIYKAALRDVSRIYITEVHADIEGDAFFPNVDFSDYDCVERQDFSAGEGNPYDYSFVVYQRR